MMTNNDEKADYNRLILVGNGFDLALGLKSKLSDFLFHIFKDLLLSLENRGKFSFTLNNTYGSKLPATLDTNQKQSITNSTSVADILDILKAIKKNGSTKFELFNTIILDSQHNWVNIEATYFKQISKMYTLVGLGKLSVLDLRSYVAKHNECMTLIGEELSRYLLLEQNKFNETESDFKKMYAIIDETFQPFVKRRDIEQKHVKPKWQFTPPKNTVFVNFNYTNVLHEILKSEFKKKEFRHIHIHGTINDVNNPIIFGYGDDTTEDYKKMELIEEDILLEKIKSFQYPRTENYHHLLNILDEAKFEVFIFGHSCGLTDKTLLNTIFEHENCFGIKNFHHSGESSDFKKRMAISRHFTDKKLMRQRLFPFDENAKFPELEIF